MKCAVCEKDFTNAADENKTIWGYEDKVILAHTQCVMDAIEEYRTSVLNFCPNGCGVFETRWPLDGTGGEGYCDKCGFHWKTS